MSEARRSVWISKFVREQRAANEHASFSTGASGFARQAKYLRAAHGLAASREALLVAHTRARLLEARPFRMTPAPDQRLYSRASALCSGLLAASLIFAGCGGERPAARGLGGAAPDSPGGNRTLHGGSAGSGAAGSAGMTAMGGDDAGAGGSANNPAGGAASGAAVAADGGRSSNGGASGGGGERVSGGVGASGSGALSGGAAGAAAASSGAGGSAGSAGSTDCSAAENYDALVLCDHPVGYWALSEHSGSEPDLSGKGHAGVYQGGAARAAELPNRDAATAFNGSNQYLTIPSHPSFSIPTTGNLTWEAWIRPDVLQFPHDSGGYVDWMGKCHEYSPSCEWEARLYNSENDQDRCNRFSAYVFNPKAGLGSGADFQPTCGLIRAGAWYHVVGEYTLESQPADCKDTAQYPGSIDIWVNGVKWNHSRHGQTGCFSQYQVIPMANDSPVNVGTMAEDAWFQGAIGKLAIYDYLLTQAEITSRYRAMTGQEPSGSCADSCTL